MSDTAGPGGRPDVPPVVPPGRWANGLDPAELDEPRAAACWAIERVLAASEPLDSAWSRLAALGSERDRAFAHRLITETLRWLLRLDFVLERLSGRRIDQIDPILLSPLRLGTVQLLFFDRVPDHAAVSTAVGLAAGRSRRGGGVVNAVLRKVADRGRSVRFDLDDPLDRLAVETSHPRFLVERWTRRFGEKRTRSLLEANNRDRRPALLVVGGRERRETVRQRLLDAGVRTEPSELSPLGLLVEEGSPLDTDLWPAGEIYPQDEASQVAALVPPPTAGERILDVAAAPGGKTLALLAWEPRLDIVAADGTVARLPRLLANRRRTGSGFALVAADARHPALHAGFDRVVVDLPCTGTGTLRKHPELKWRITAEEIDRLVALGAEILDGAAGLVRQGGLLVVITCSLEREENEGQAEAFLDRHPDFGTARLEERLPSSWSRFLETPSLWRILPAADHDGFTVSVMRRDPEG
ncbi:MAG: transcription antitermination factor NusB [Thermoanaerobaculia bacterium]|nr:transcription antitermination factor NusB [Thermoanaerobaculia bacterium]